MPQTETNDQNNLPQTEEQAHRAGMYSLLGAVLRSAPDQQVLQFIAELEHEADEQGPELPLALQMLALAARHTSVDSARDEYHLLFIGLGRGELVPYGSWYQTGFLMEKPLGQLRADLARLGFERDEQVKEPEDHVAALCEVMALLIQDQTPLEAQRHFFESHMADWFGTFCDDLAAAESAVFYRSVARFAAAFLAVEKRYLALLA